MQSTKDTFYITLRDRLVQRDPALTIRIDGAIRPAMVVLENEPAVALPGQDDAFYLQWGEVEAVHPASCTLMKMECVITYTSRGQAETGGVGRGRDLAVLDADLLAICSPPQAYKYDYATGVPVELGSFLFWSAPALKTLKTEAGQVGREAHVSVFFYPEVNQL
jgi:hypothetical protein